MKCAFRFKADDWKAKSSKGVCVLVLRFCSLERFSWPAAMCKVVCPMSLPNERLPMLVSNATSLEWGRLTDVQWPVEEKRRGQIAT